MNEGGPTKEGKTIKGEVLRVEGDNFFVTGQDGKEVRLYIDQTIQKTGNIQQGDQIEVMVNDENQALSLRSPDRRNEHHDHTADSALEAGQTGSKGQ